MDKAKEKKKDTLDTIIKIVLIIVIILLLVHNCTLLGKLNKKKIPTGNVDIIEIQCDRGDQCEIVPSDDNPKTDIKPFNNDKINNKTENKENTDSGSGSGTEPSSGEEEEELDADFGVLDSDHSKITWSGATDLNIFEKSAYVMEGRIAPESENTYEFDVKNGTDFNVKYSMEFSEENPHNINLKYKLRKNDTYLIDHYVYFNELDLANQLLNASTTDKYYLDWKWESTDHDNEPGMLQAEYSLTINVKAESIDG